MCKYTMNVYVGSEQAASLTADQVLFFHNSGINFVVEGDELPADVQVYDLPSGEQIIYTEESIGQDSEGNELYVMRPFRMDDPV